MKKYMIYMEDSKDCFKLAIPARSTKDAKACVAGNGNVISVKDVTDDYPISLDKVRDALFKSGFGQIEIDFITRALDQIGICE